MAGWQDGEGAFGLVGTPLENGWQAAAETPVPTNGSGGIQSGGTSPLWSGAGGRKPRGKGWAKIALTIFVREAWPRGKALPQGAFSWGVPPSNPKDSNPLSCFLLPGLRLINPDSPRPTPPDFLLHNGGNLASWFFHETRSKRLYGRCFWFPLP